jgi:hypothetical protein
MGGMIGMVVRIGASLFATAMGLMPLHAEATDAVDQQVQRLNVELNASRPAYTAVDCFESEHCLQVLVQEVGRAGGNIGKLAHALGSAAPELIGEDYSYSFAPPPGQSFCKAVIVRLSIAPTFGKGAPELIFYASRSAARAVVRLPKPEKPSARVWFDGVLILFSVTDPDQGDCTIISEMRETGCKGGQCLTIRF